MGLTRSRSSVREHAAVVAVAAAVVVGVAGWSSNGYLLSLLLLM